MDFERVRREKFLDNNARVLRAVNALRERYIKITDLEYGLGAEMNSAEISDCINYLNESGYIKLRSIEGHTEIADLADAEMNTIEAKLTAKGIAFLNGKINDPCIRR
ncbi:MAG: type VI secretion protein [Oscillospiraceae bacterium]|nr:type VI secretion protein [Oscillospiraceae bacterium]